MGDTVSVSYTMVVGFVISIRLVDLSTAEESSGLESDITVAVDVANRVSLILGIDEDNTLESDEVVSDTDSLLVISVARDESMELSKFV